VEYNFRNIEQAAKQFWKDQQVYKVTNTSDKPKYYVLDMFPYPSGAGLHVGHPLGYIASDIFSRYKVMKGFNVLHPMGFDAFGLPAEQYALETGQHPVVTTEKNITRYKEQLDNIGFNYDWSREVRTSDPKYYKWTQWIFLQLFQSWFNRTTQKAEPLESLVAIFEKEGNKQHPAPGADDVTFTAEDWKIKTEEEQRAVLMHYRLAYLDHAVVWWCEALGTVLANDEVVNGVSERGGHPVEKKKMRQWFLRITEFADRMIDSLNNLEWSEAMKEMQRNWIGRSEGAEVTFHLSPTLSKGEGDVSEKEIDDLPEYYTAKIQEWNANIGKAKEMRHEPTEAEDYLWQQLRGQKLGFKFRRQHPIGSYIPDFVCLSKKLIVEVDGGYHSQIEQKDYDEKRTIYFNGEGYTILRFSNEEVLVSTNSILEKIEATLKSLPDQELKTPVSLPFGEGRGGVIPVFTTRPDTIFGVDFMVLAPEHELVNTITTAEQKAEVDQYVAYVKSRSERERMSEKKISGCFTGAYAIHPFTGKQIPVWISEYVLAGYGTGAIMAVPAGDDRDHAFAKHFNIPITNIFGDLYNGETAVADKNVTISNSEFINNLDVKEAASKVLSLLEEKNIGTRKINYKLRDAGFSRQRYWGEPFPIVYRNNVPYAINEPAANLPEALQQLPLELPHIENYKPGPEGEGPLANITDWVYIKDNNGELVKRETNTMPGYAGSSWYFLRYMDPNDDATFADKNATDYWKQVDLYIGGTEHAVGHLLYSRMWTKALYDLGFLSFDEPFKRLVNQGMIQGSTRYVYRINGTNTFVSLGLKGDHLIDQIRVDVNFVDGVELDTEAFKQWRPEYADAEFILEDGKYICGSETEKMSKSKYNVVNPDDIVNQYGADTFRMYEMFLGPIEMSKPWDTKGIEGVHRFLKKLWRLYNDEQKGWIVTDEKATDAELKTLHKTIKKIESDTEKFSFNTAVSQFMICVNDLTEQNCHKREILDPLVRILAAYAPHVAEELWKQLGNGGSVIHATFPQWNEKYTTENSKVYPIAVNGKARTELEFALDAEQSFIEQEVLSNTIIQKWLEGKEPKKFIYVPGRMINVVI
jgi:leucyl-tRNA synthetase